MPSSASSSSSKTTGSSLSKAKQTKEQELFIALPIPQFLGCKEAYTHENLRTRLHFTQDAIIDFRDKMPPRLDARYNEYLTALRVLLDDDFSYLSKASQGKLWDTVLKFDNDIQKGDLQLPKSPVEQYIQDAVLDFQRWIYFARYGSCPESWSQLDHNVWDALSNTVRKEWPTFQEFVKGDNSSRKQFPVTLYIYHACHRIGICPNDFLFQARYYRKPARVPFFGIGQAIELAEHKHLAQLLHRDLAGVPNVVPVGDKKTKTQLSTAILLQVNTYFKVKKPHAWAGWKPRKMPKPAGYHYFKNFGTDATSAELKAAILLESTAVDKNGMMLEQLDPAEVERPGTPCLGAVRERWDGVVFDPVYSGRMIHRSRYDFREMRKLKKGPSWKAAVTLESFGDGERKGKGTSKSESERLADRCANQTKRRGSGRRSL